MPVSKLNKGDIFDDSFFKALQDADKYLKDLLVTFRNLAKEAREISKGVSAAKSFNEVTRAAKAASEATTKLTAEEKRLERASKELAFQESEAGKKLAETNYKKNQAAKANRDYAKSQDSAAKSTNRWGIAIKSFQFKFNALGNLIANAAGTVFRAFIRAVRQSVDIIKNFDSSTARLASVLGKTKSEITGLTKEAKQLGSITKYTASQVTNLQTELARLGFTAEEISAATPGILSFATATGADLPEAAKTAGVAVRAFGLSTAETEEAVATLAVATTKSALTFSDYETILSTLGPVARAYGFTLEDTVALTGKLRDAGFDASKAATATRNILLNLADANGKLAKKLGGSVSTFDELIDGLVSLDKQGVGLNETLQLTDKRSVAAFNTFLKTAGGARELKGEITGVTEQLQGMVDVQIDTLAGDLDLLRSAWEGLILSLSENGGILRTTVQLLTNAALELSNLDLATTKFNKQNSDQIARSFELLGKLTNKQGERFQFVVEWLDAMDLAKVKSDEMYQHIVDSFQSIRKVNAKEAEALANEYLRRRQEEADKEIELERLKKERIAKETAEAAKKAALPTEEQIKAREALNKAYEETARLLANLKPPDDIISTFNISTGGYDLSTIQDDLDTYMNNLFDYDKQLEDDAKEATDVLIDQFKKRSEAEIEQERKTSELVKQITDEKNAYKIDIINESFNFLSTSLDRQLAKAESNANAQLRNENLTAEQRKSIENKLAEEKAKIQRKAAIVDKAQSLFNIAINTATAVTKVLAQTGLLGTGLIPLILGLGAVQAATVIATPIPAFEKGTDSAPGGLAITGEKGRELLIGPNGKIGLTPDSANLMNIEKGTKIFPSDITNELLQYTTIANGLEGKKDERVILAVMQKIDQSNNRLYRAIKDKPISSSSLTPAGIRTLVYKGNTVIKRTDKYFK